MNEGQTADFCMFWNLIYSFVLFFATFSSFNDFLGGEGEMLEFCIYLTYTAWHVILIMSKQMYYTFGSSV